MPTWQCVSTNQCRYINEMSGEAGPETGEAFAMHGLSAGICCFIAVPIGSIARSQWSVWNNNERVSADRLIRMAPLVMMQVAI